DQDADCGVQNGQVTAEPQGGTAPYTYSWTGGGTSKTNANLGANTYTVTVTDANNCTATAQATVANSSGFTATVTVDQNENCGQQNGQLSATPQGGTAPYTYSWTGGGTAQTNANLGAGNYTVTVTDANNCTATAQGTIVNNAGFTVQSQVTNPTCLNPTGSATVTTNGGTAPFTYSWSNGDNTANATNLAVGTHIVTVTDATNCSVNDTVTITQNTQQPTITISGGNTVCTGVSTTLTASGATSYSWSTGATTSAITESPAVTTTYTVTGTDANGCSGTASITVSVLTGASLAIDVDTTAGCAPLTVFFTSSIPNADTYSWSFGDGQTSSLAAPSHTYYGDSCFAVSLDVSFANGCSYTANLDSLICITPGPTADFTTSTTTITNVYSDVTFTNQSQNATSYTWNFGDGKTSNLANPKHTYDPTLIANYVAILVAENQFGCTDTARVVIKMLEDIIFYVPNTFTPDGDEFNNVFKPVIADGFDAFDFEMLIFNRWGEVIFETRNPKVGWDGTFLGKISQDGTYTWQITFKKATVDDKIIKRGHVTLLR
ncbi:MAG TPA: PKD domain-containing protein, partial [Crocinitomicaceae bacterium]|nr:PKD domain-containing protein [Crocinitomicaceae bacterium]